jgi:hypothetical protein
MQKEQIDIIHNIEKEKNLRKQGIGFLRKVPSGLENSFLRLTACEVHTLENY